MNSYQTPGVIESDSDCATTGSYEGQQRSFKNPRTAAGCICDTPSCRINIEHIADIDLDPSSESSNLLKR